MPRIMDIELKRLKEDTLKMGELAKNSIREAIHALINRDAKLASKVIDDETVVDELEFEIENKCVDLILLRQPMAKDLRIVVTILKIITDLDRISDLAKDISVITLHIGKEAFVKPLIDIPRMSEIAQGMIADCLNAFSQEKIDSLKDFSERDDLVDALTDQVRRELIIIMIENPHSITQSNRLLFVALHLERIADHACNIASRIYYMVTGNKIKFE
ncbi:MAG: phosphate signaling complex protein PhoU [Candidatus Methylarchaceae archaeon HK02M1]|nr:phosphate signaling complex protein PhoU [Candidatus Methylarchaceae archaeon HK01M]MCP8312112.1 phosphate signaling complex protein PhoU [Candidatus Methylarchaceae archaeon HK02M1]